MQPFFTVIIPTYNRPEFLKRALESVFDQSFNDFEVVVVNDGSTQGTDLYSELNRTYSNQSSFKMLFKVNEGLAAARNTGIETANGKFVCFLDDDDYYLDNHLQELYKLIKDKNETDGFYRTFTEIELKGGKLKKQIIEPIQPNENPLLKIQERMVSANNVCISKGILENYKFNPAVPIAEDYELWMRIIAKYPYFESHVITTHYDLSRDSMSSGSWEKNYKYIETFDNIFGNREVIAKLSKIDRKRIYQKYYDRIIPNLVISSGIGSLIKSRSSIVKRAGARYYFRSLVLGLIKRFR
ncbi:MAG: glycosyltransferase family 2 protein [Flavobacteriales bacterium]|nr:glycosyltransferase family 2 protein [Flavobacteriales bacterium]